MAVAPTAPRGTTGLHCWEDWQTPAIGVGPDRDTGAAPLRDGAGRVGRGEGCHHRGQQDDGHAHARR